MDEQTQQEDQEQEQPLIVPWYRSAVLMRLAISLVCQLLAATHTSRYLSNATAAQIVETIFQVCAILGLGGAAHARVVYKRPTAPVALTKKQAENANEPGEAKPSPPPTVPPT